MKTFALCIMVPFVSDHSPFNYFGQVWLVRLRQYLHMTILKETDGSIHSAISFILTVILRLACRRFCLVTTMRVLLVVLEDTPVIIVELAFQVLIIEILKFTLMT